MNGRSTHSSQIHLGLAVSNLQRSKQFYETLLGHAPCKERPGYVKFELESPSVNLTLNEVGPVQQSPDPSHHYGIQVQSAQAVRDAIDLFHRAGLETRVEEQTTCCYAVQAKVWVTDPDGNSWEVFFVLEDAGKRMDADSECCARVVGSGC